MVVRSYKTSPIIARVNVDIAITELQDMLVQYKLLRETISPDLEVPQLDALIAHLHQFNETIDNS